MTSSSFSDTPTIDAEASRVRDTMAGALGSEVPFVAGGSSDNPGGSEDTGSGEDNTGTEQPGETIPPAVEVTAGVGDGTSPSDTGGGGGGAILLGGEQSFF